RVPAVATQRPRLRVVRQIEIEVTQDPLSVRLLAHGKGDLDPAEEVALHPVGTREIQLARLAIAEEEDARMLEKAAHHRAHPDVLGDPWNAGPERAEAADDEVYVHAFARCAIQCFDDLWVDQRIHLRDDPAGFAIARQVRFAIYLLHHGFVESE